MDIVIFWQIFQQLMKKAKFCTEMTHYELFTQDLVVFHLYSLRLRLSE